LANIINIADNDKQFTNMLLFSLSTVTCGACYVEFKSIIENLIAINVDKEGNESDFAVYFLLPMHKLLILKLSKKQNDES
jgi:hypothetical protein